MSAPRYSAICTCLGGGRARGCFGDALLCLGEGLGLGVTDLKFISSLFSDLSVDILNIWINLEAVLDLIPLPSCLSPFDGVPLFEAPALLLPRFLRRVFFLE